METNKVVPILILGTAGSQANAIGTLLGGRSLSEMFVGGVGFPIELREVVSIAALRTEFYVNPTGSVCVFGYGTNIAEICTPPWPVVVVVRASAHEINMYLEQNPPSNIVREMSRLTRLDSVIASFVLRKYAPTKVRVLEIPSDSDASESAAKILSLISEGLD